MLIFLNHKILDLMEMAVQFPTVHFCSQLPLASFGHLLGPVHLNFHKSISKIMRKLLKFYLYYYLKVHLLNLELILYYFQLIHKQLEKYFHNYQFRLLFQLFCHLDY